MALVSLASSWLPRIPGTGWTDENNICGDLHDKFIVADKQLFTPPSLPALPITMGELTAHSVHRSEHRSETRRRQSFMAVSTSSYVKSTDDTRTQRYHNIIIVPCILHAIPN